MGVDVVEEVALDCLAFLIRVSGNFGDEAKSCRAGDSLVQVASDLD
jgi:hypothetical protein